ncbi:chemotaxis protein CheW [Aquibacillus koreensis]|uniref:Chemotaxis protein CheW n=1 Tax=Aquibacillus koreensis TaxID=279446 RepID=A0A9X4AHS4_9BACI|nr:chemotaxis protein CheW [Aquibacillus koreensis]MCT2535956.1 chemotaxis protein CheW [Aquibacillus koreensis]MDC3420412.1 chemotaxis protein CheW [Aquibacillus koreensis]
MADAIKIIIFKLHNQEYGANITQIRSIEKLQDVVKVPQTSDFIKGIINLRGQVTPIIDLKQRLGMQETEKTDQTRVLIASMNNIEVGLIVDSATDVIDIETSLIEETPEMVQGVDSKYLNGVAKLDNRLLLLLDLENVLNYKEIDEVKQVIED